MSDGQVAALREMASILQRWLDHQERARTSEGLPTNDDTALAAPPQWPSKSQLKTFIHALLVVADDIGRLNSKLSDATREIAQLSLEVARRVSRDDAAYVVGALEKLYGYWIKDFNQAEAFGRKKTEVFNQIKMQRFREFNNLRIRPDRSTYGATP